MSTQKTQTDAAQTETSIVSAIIDRFTRDRPTAAAPPTADLKTDELFMLLKNPRRRGIIRKVDAAEERIVFGELVDQLAAIEEDTTPEKISSSARKRVYVSCYQVHLPKLEEYDVIEVGEKPYYVSPGANLPASVRLLEVASPLIQES